MEIEDYLTDAQMRNIAEKEFRKAIRQNMRGEEEIQRILTNLSYNIVMEAIAEVWDKNVTEYLRDTAKRIITSPTSLEYELFRDGKYGLTKGQGTIALEGMMDELRPIIREEAEKRIREYPFYELRKDEISDTISELIMEKFLEAAENSAK